MDSGTSETNRKEWPTPGLRAQGAEHSLRLLAECFRPTRPFSKRDAACGERSSEGKGQGRTAPGIGGPSSGCPRAGPRASHWPKQGRKMGTYEPVRAALSCGLGSHLRCPRPTRRGPAHTSGSHLFPDGQLQALRLDPRPQALEVLVEALPVSRCVGHKVLLRSQEQHGLLPHTEDDALLPGARGRKSPQSGRDARSTAPARPLSRPFPSSRALHPAVALTPESHPGSKAQTKCHLLPTLPPLWASSPPSERPNVNSPL